MSFTTPFFSPWSPWTWLPMPMGYPTPLSVPVQMPPPPYQHGQRTPHYDPRTIGAGDHNPQPFFPDNKSRYAAQPYAHATPSTRPNGSTLPPSQQAAPAPATSKESVIRPPQYLQQQGTRTVASQSFTLPMDNIHRVIIEYGGGTTTTINPQPSNPTQQNQQTPFQLGFQPIYPNHNPGDPNAAGGSCLFSSQPMPNGNDGHGDATPQHPPLDGHGNSGYTAPQAQTPQGNWNTGHTTPHSAAAQTQQAIWNASVQPPPPTGNGTQAAPHLATPHPQSGQYLSPNDYAARTGLNQAQHPSTSTGHAPNLISPWEQASPLHASTGHHTAQQAFPYPPPTQNVSAGHTPWPNPHQGLNIGAAPPTPYNPNTPVIPNMNSSTHTTPQIPVIPDMRSRTPANPPAPLPVPPMPTSQGPTPRQRGVPLQDYQQPRQNDDGSPKPGSRYLHRDLSDIQWDVRESIRNSKVSWNQSNGIGPRRLPQFDAPACPPQITRIVMRFDIQPGTLIGWRALEAMFAEFRPIIVVSTPTKERGAPITVRNVLEAMQEWLFRELSVAELSSVSAKGLLDQVHEERARRVKAQQSEHTLLHRGDSEPIRVVDLLAPERHKLKGIDCEDHPRHDTMRVSFKF